MNKSIAQNWIWRYIFLYISPNMACTINSDRPPRNKFSSPSKNFVLNKKKSCQCFKPSFIGFVIVPVMCIPVLSQAYWLYSAIRKYHWSFYIKTCPTTERLVYWSFLLLLKYHVVCVDYLIYNILFCYWTSVQIIGLENIFLGLSSLAEKERLWVRIWLFRNIRLLRHQ